MDETSGRRYIGLEKPARRYQVVLPRRSTTRRCIGAALRSRRQYTARRRLVCMSCCSVTFAYRSYQRVPLRLSAHPSARILFTSHPGNPRHLTRYVSIQPSHPSILSPLSLPFRGRPLAHESNRAGHRVEALFQIAKTQQRWSNLDDDSWYISLSE